MVQTITLRYCDFRAYFDWIATGFARLAQQGRLQLRLENLLHTDTDSVDPQIRHEVAVWKKRKQTDSKCPRFPYLLGEVKELDRCVHFVFEISDAPFEFHLEWLRCADLYFKCQCPKIIDAEGFPITSDIRLPYSPAVIELRHKIRPAMVGRPLSGRLDIDQNLALLTEWEQAAQATKTTRLFAYYHHDRGPVLAWAMNSYAARLAELNVRRARIVRWLKTEVREEIDARVVNAADTTLRLPGLDHRDYFANLARSVFNIHVTSYCRSIPFRFVDSFLTRTSVISDEQAVRWYREFEAEVELFSLGTLGYELDSDIDWDAIWRRLRCLYDGAMELHASIRPRLIECYHRKWRPERIADYVQAECGQLVQGKK